MFSLIYLCNMSNFVFMNIKASFNRIPVFLKNKYSITFFIFFIWLLFFDENNLLTQYELQREIYLLNEDKNYYQEEIKKLEESLNELMTNEEKLEKFAREKYLMKKPNEDIFIIVEE
jgi:cell division protein DivIC